MKEDDERVMVSDCETQAEFKPGHGQSWQLNLAAPAKETASCYIAPRPRLVEPTDDSDARVVPLLVDYGFALEDRQC